MFWPGSEPVCATRCRIGDYFNQVRAGQAVLVGPEFVTDPDPVLSDKPGFSCGVVRLSEAVR